MVDQVVGVCGASVLCILYNYAETMRGLDLHGRLCCVAVESVRFMYEKRVRVRVMKKSEINWRMEYE